MGRLNLTRGALSVCVGAALLAGCGLQPPMSAGAIPRASTLAMRTSSTSYRVLYGFGGPPDGYYPAATLIDVGGTLYGTTFQGGKHKSSCYGGGSCGTVFSVTTDGTEKVLYRFGAAPDGNNPTASLLYVKGRLYGTTSRGGRYDNCGYTNYHFTCGTVFRITTGGREKVLHSFGSLKDGTEPGASLIKMNGVLYGTTASGGGMGGGSVFSITPSGTEKYFMLLGLQTTVPCPRRPSSK